MDTSKLIRVDLIPMLVGAARAIVRNSGTDATVKGATGLLRVATSGAFQVSIMTALAEAIGEFPPCTLDVWYADTKVFSVGWNSELLRDYELISMKRGPWIPALMDLASADFFDSAERRMTLVVEFSNG